MKIQVSKENLLTGINAVQKAVSTKNIMPVLACIRLEAKDDTLFFMATNLDMGIQCHVPANVMQEGIILVSARYFSEIARKLPDVIITLELSDQRVLNIQCEQLFFSLVTISPEDFPIFPENDYNFRFFVLAPDLRKMIKNSAFAASTDELRALFTGILWEFTGNTLTMVSTDTHRLALSSGLIESSEPLTGQFIVPSKTLVEVGRLIQEEPCQIHISLNLAYFMFDNIVIYCRLLEGKFPDYRSVIPQDPTIRIRVKTQAFLDAVERVALFSTDNQNSKTIQLSIIDEKMTVFSKSDIGQGDEEVFLVKEGENIQIAFNSSYLIEGLKVMESEEVSFCLTQALNPGVIRPHGDDSFVYLVLPIRA